MQPSAASPNLTSITPYYYIYTQLSIFVSWDLLCAKNKLAKYTCRNTLILNNNILDCIFQDDFFVWPSVSDMFWQMIAVDYKSQEKKWAFTCLDRWVTKTGSVNVETVQEKEKEKLSKRKRKATIQCNDTSNGLLHRHNTLLSLNLIEQGQTRYYFGTLPGLITNWFNNPCC